MLKELVFLKIGEHCEPHNFLAKIEHLIQIQITETTPVDYVLDEIERIVENGESILAIRKYGLELEHRPGDTFMALHGFIPEPGVKLFAIFNLRTVE